MNLRHEAPSGRRPARFPLCRLVCFLTVLLPMFGCSISELDTVERLERGLVIVLPGIEGRSIWNVNIARGLDDGGVDHGIEIFDWGTAVPFGMLINLTDQDRNCRVAKALDDRILEYQDRHPGRPVQLVGHSGGAGIAIMAVEQLPRERQIASMVLLGAAVSPQHDLRQALRRTDHGIYNYFSDRDIGLLKVGTSLFGTMDRRFGASAGALGFVRPRFLREADNALYDKLHQIRWRPVMRVHGNAGGHADWTNRRFVRRYLAPVIVDTSSKWKIVDRNRPGRSGRGSLASRGSEAARENTAARLPDRKGLALPD